MLQSLGRALSERNHLISWASTLTLVLLLVEVVLNILIIQFVPYTEIDWKAYMQEVEGVVNGTYDYTQLKGDTGPLVYPAGFVYLYYILYFVTNKGVNIALAQYIFMILYIATLAMVFTIYKRTDTIPVWAFVLLTLSRRVHSIFVLRLFNDCFAMFFLFIAVYFFIRNRWSFGCFIYSYAVSIKMNILLFAPGLLLLLIKRFGIWGTIPKLAICAAVQIVLAIPFLLENPIGYIVKSFELSRKFIFYWSVNWQFLPEWLFLDGRWGILLITATAVVLYLFASKLWTRSEKGLWAAVFNPPLKQPTAEHIVTVLFTSNFVGVVFSRTLHYQFYSWYFHTLPHLLFSTHLPAIVNVALIAIIELIWNIFPPRPWTSLVLQSCHLIILLALLFSTPRPAYYSMMQTPNKTNKAESKQAIKAKKPKQM